MASRSFSSCFKHYLVLHRFTHNAQSMRILHVNFLYPISNFHVGDNRGDPDSLDPKQTLKQALNSTTKGDIETSIESSDENRKQNHDDLPRSVPRSVELIRERLRSIHSLPDQKHGLKFKGDQVDSEHKDNVVSQAKKENVASLRKYAKQNPRSEEPCVNTAQIRQKYTFLKERKSEKVSERVIETSFGLVRLDEKPDKTQSTKISEGSVITQEKAINVDELQSKKIKEQAKSAENHSQTENLFDEAYFGGVLTTDLETSDSSHIRNNESFSPQMTPTSKQSAEYQHNEEGQSDTLEEQYFNRGDFEDLPHLSNFVSDPELSIEEFTKNVETGPSMNSTDPYAENFFDEEYFGEDTHTKQEGKEIGSNNTSLNKELDEFQPSQNVLRTSTQSKTPAAKTMQSSVTPESLEAVENIYIEQETKQEKRHKAKKEADLDDPRTAYDMAMRIRLEKRGRDVNGALKETNTGTVPNKARWTGQTDSHGFRILKNQVLDVREMPQDVLISILRDSILYEDDEMIAIDKPYGLPSHGGPGVHHSVGQLLKPLLEKLHRLKEVESLQLIHRLDKQTTGVMLIAKNTESQKKLQSMFKKRQVIKKYWLLTKGIPNPTEGVIDIPLTEGTVGINHRMTLSPNYPAENRLMLKTSKDESRSEAITNYKVLDSNNSAALVECQPESGVKHQIRCHMAFALNTPILGDHKYSHLSKIAPQRLYPEILRCLGIRQSKVRHLPMHLHAQQIILPEFKNGRNLFISARLPKHFVQNMKWLKIKPPS